MVRALRVTKGGPNSLSWWLVVKGPREVHRKKKGPNRRFTIIGNHPKNQQPYLIYGLSELDKSMGQLKRNTKQHAANCGKGTLLSPRGCGDGRIASTAALLRVVCPCVLSTVYVTD